ncbi:DUF805 domain-containing protein [Mesorhizobium sp. Z1-4]|uniref:DUF805 domain-containing protein n=1 Tax=Mesorhizobium sp. Z1-4 TaxID=2448478 RepID=UPI000FD6F892|nr:DUF805 domain-containing protein [Mesorhizobium sp. Z1-4]
MKSGEIIYFDGNRGTGFITGNDGNRYVFDVTDLANDQPASKGAKVSFAADGDRARAITPQLAPAAARHAAAAATPWGVADTADGMPPISGAIDPDGPPASPGLIGYFRYCVTRGYVRFSGRARRREYWSFVVVALIGFAVAGGLGYVVGTALGFDEAEEPTISALAISVFWLYLLLPSMAVLFRRLHDIGLSGWFWLLAFVPMFGSLIILVMMLIGSQKHDNKWGPVPTGAHV